MLVAAMDAATFLRRHRRCLRRSRRCAIARRVASGQRRDQHRVCRLQRKPPPSPPRLRAVAVS